MPIVNSIVVPFIVVAAVLLQMMNDPAIKTFGGCTVTPTPFDSNETKVLTGCC